MERLRTTAHQAAYQEGLLEKKSWPFITDCPRHLGVDQLMLERETAGDMPTEQDVLTRYFERMRAEDLDYFEQVQKIAETMAERSPEVVDALSERRLQIIVPAYREGESIDRFLNLLERQYNHAKGAQWGVTIVLDYTLPYSVEMEYDARRKVEERVTAFLADRPHLRPHVHTIFYHRRKETQTKILPVALARKVGEDVMMYTRTRLRSTGDARSPLYLGMMDMDTGNLEDGVFDQMTRSVPNSEAESAHVIRVQGSFDRDMVRQYPYIYPLEMMWEGATSAIGEGTRNPFTVGRLAAVPLREFAITGGGYVGKLAFPDEDIRRGMQVAWQFPAVSTVEVDGRYSTSPRREIATVLSVMGIVRDRQGIFDRETMEVAALIRMYGNWSNASYRGVAGEVVDSSRVFSDVEQFDQAVPPALLEATVNAFYRFTLYSMYAVDVLSQEGGLSEVQRMRGEFLATQRPFFSVQLDTLRVLETLEHDNPTEFERVRHLLEEVDRKARESMRKILIQHHVAFTEDDSFGPIYGITEQPVAGQDRDHTPLRVRFRIAPSQPNLMQYIRLQIEQS